MELETTKQGAAAVSRIAKKNPTEVMQTLVDGDPNAPFESIYRRWVEIIRGDDDYVEAVERYAGQNIWTNVTRRRQSPRRSMQLLAEAQNAAAARVTALVHEVIQRVLTLNFIMPNGSMLGDCRGTYVAEQGGIFAAIGKKAGKRLVSQAFTESQLQALTNKANGAHD